MLVFSDPSSVDSFVTIVISQDICSYLEVSFFFSETEVWTLTVRQKIAGVHAVRKPHRDVWYFPQSCHDEKEGQLSHCLENKVLLLPFLKVSSVVMLVFNFSCSQGWLSTLIFLTSAMLGHKCTLLYLVLCSAGTKFGFHAWSASTLPTKVHTQLLLCFCFSASILCSSSWS